ncbi:MAG: hypothetical protein SFW66_09495 [Gammaproteobacteria bacterium]|nr:hypothetical protein [Gammaproteobacteria bacterium]
MKITWTWLNDNIFSPIYAAPQTIYSTLVHSNWLREKLADIYSGFTRTFELSNLSELLFIPHASSIVSESIRVNASPLALYLTAEWALGETRAVFSEQPAIYYSCDAITFAARTVFAWYALRALYQNKLLTIVMAKRVSDRTREPEDKCACATGDLIKAEAFAPVDYLFRSLAIRYLPMPQYVRWAADIFNHGYTLLEYRYGMRMCTRHRAIELAKNNAYAFGIGLSFYAVCNYLLILAERYTGASGFMLEQFIYSAMYPWFIASVLLRAPLVKRKEFDVFYYHRYLARHFIEQSAVQISSLFEGPAEPIDWDAWIKKLNTYPYVVAFSKWMGKSVEEFFTDEIHAMLFDIYYDQIKANMKEIIDIQKPLRQQKISGLPRATILSLVVKLPSYMSSFFISKNDKRLLKTIKEKTLRDPVKIVNACLETLRAIQLNRRVLLVEPEALPVNRYSFFMERALQDRPAPEFEIINSSSAIEEEKADEKIQDKVAETIEEEKMIDVANIQWNYF